MSSSHVTLHDRSCTLCGPGAGKKVRYPANFSEADLNAAIFSARRMPDRRHFRLVECEACGMVYSDPAADAADLARLYHDSQVTYGTQEQEIYESYAPILDRALAWTEGRKAFVEIGGGRGFMLRYGAEKGFAEQVEVEPSADAEKQFQPPTQNARFVRGLFTKGLLPPNSASLVCFFQTLDHVPDPKAFLEAVYEVLEPGGVALCVTHDTRALSAKVLGERSPIYDIEHTYLFHQGNLPALFRAAGFAEAEAFTVANDYALRHWLRMVPVPGPAREALLKTANVTGLGSVRVKLRAGNFATVGRKAR